MREDNNIEYDVPVIIKVLDEDIDTKDKLQDKKKHIMRDNILVLVKKTVLLVLMFYILFFHIFGFTRMNDQSMSPNIAAGDLLFFYRLDKNYAIGDVVTFKYKGKQYQLRIIALEGQTISLGKDGSFLVDGGAELHSTYFKTFVPIDKGVKYPYKVEKGKVFVVGDYRVEANDSRLFGAIDKDSIEGKVISLLQTKDI